MGGYPRDIHFGNEPNDYDLATDAYPNDIQTILTNNKYKCNLQGKDFGVIVAYRKDLPKDGVEIATFREDLTKGRKPEVKVGATIEEDSKRRDLTINALYYDMSNDKIIDLVGGIADIKNSIIRMVGNPVERITEDQLRVLRVVRFACRYGFKIDEDTKKAIIEHANLSEVSRERIFEELIKAQEQSKSITSYFFLLKELNLLSKIFPLSKVGEPLLCFKTMELLISQILINDSPKDLERKLINDYKFSKELSYAITYFVNLKNLTSDNVLAFYRKKAILNISNEDLEAWISVNCKELESFLAYRPIHNIEELMANGFSEKALGVEIKRIEKINFESLKNKNKYEL